MNILLVTPFFKPQTGGVVTYLEGLRQGLSAAGHNVYVLRDGETQSITECGFNRDPAVLQFRMRPLFWRDAPLKSPIAFLAHFAPTYYKLARFVRNKGIDVVCLEYPADWMSYFLLLRPLLGFKIVVDVHGDDVLSLCNEPWSYRAMVKTLARTADAFVAHSKSLRDQAVAILGCALVTTILPYWVDSKQLVAQADAKRTEDNTRPRSGYVLTVAKLYGRKGVDVLLRAIGQLRHLGLHHTFCIAGDGPQASELKELAVKLDLGGVRFLGEVNTQAVAGLYPECELFVLPSRVEPFGIVLLEAMTFGKAIVATDVGGIPEFVRPGYNGLLVPADDANALAEAIRIVLEESALRDDLGQNGLNLVKSKYDVRIVFQQYDQFFASLAGGAR